MEVLRGSEGEEEEEEEWEEAEEGIEVEEVEEVDEEEEEEELSHELQQLAESELGETEQVVIICQKLSSPKTSILLRFEYQGWPKCAPGLNLRF